MATRLSKRLANQKADFHDYCRTSLAEFYISPAHRWLVYALVFILSGLSAFGALTLCDLYDELVNVPLTFKGMYAWHTAANFAICLCVTDIITALGTRNWGAYNRRTVGKAWIVFLSAFIVSFLSQRILVYRLIGLYQPALLWTYEMNPSQRPGSGISFVITLLFVLIIYWIILKIMLSLQARSEELVRVRIDSILEERVNRKAGPDRSNAKTQSHDHHLQLPTDPDVGPIRQSQIGHVTAEDHYLRIYYQSDGHYKDTLIRMPLRELSTQLSSDQFARIHRSHIVNLQSVSGVKRVGRQVKLIVKHGDHDLPVSRYRLPKLLPVLEIFLNSDASQ